MIQTEQEYLYNLLPALYRVRCCGLGRRVCRPGARVRGLGKQVAGLARRGSDQQPAGCLDEQREHL